MPSAAQATEAEDRVELDRVRRDSGLAVVEVEKGNPGDTRLRAEPDVAPGYAHLATPQRRRAPGAVRGGRLRDHVVRPARPSLAELGFDLVLHLHSVLETARTDLRISLFAKAHAPTLL